MKKLLLSSAILSCVLSTYAMEKDEKGKEEKDDIVLVNQNTEGQETETLSVSQEEEKFIPIGKKFRMNEKTGKFEDALISDQLIFKFRSAVGSIDEVFGVEKTELNKDLESIDQHLEKMEKGSVPYKATGIYRKKVVKILEKIQEDREGLLEKEFLLQKFLQAIYNPQPSYHSTPPFLCVANYELLSQTPIEDMISDFSCDGLAKRVGKSVIPLEISTSLPGELIQEMFMLSQGSSQSWIWKLSEIQENIFKISEIIYLIATKQEDSRSIANKVLPFEIHKAIKQDDTETLVALNEKMEALRSKASDRLIPMLAPNYYMAKIIMEFQKEVQESQKETSKENK